MSKDSREIKQNLEDNLTDKQLKNLARNLLIENHIAFYSIQVITIDLNSRNQVQVLLKDDIPHYKAEEIAKTFYNETEVSMII